MSFQHIRIQLTGCCSRRWWRWDHYWLRGRSKGHWVHWGLRRKCNWFTRCGKLGQGRCREGLGTLSGQSVP